MPGAREHVRDPVTHCACANHSHCLDCHSRAPFAEKQTSLSLCCEFLFRNFLPHRGFKTDVRSRGKRSWTERPAGGLMIRNLTLAALAFAVLAGTIGRAAAQDYRYYDGYSRAYQGYRNGYNNGYYR